MQATLKTIANKCGVNVSTVSRALRDDPCVIAATRQRIQEEAGAQGYTPNHYARGLQSGKTGMVWLLLSSLTNGLEQKLAHQASLCLRDAGYDLLVGAHYEDEQLYRRALSRLEQRAADGVMVIPGWEKESPEVFNRLSKAGIPLVFMDRYIEGVQAPVVTTDNRRAAAELVRLGARAGARGVICLGHASDTAAAEREQGFLEQARKLKLPLWRAETLEAGSISKALPDDLLMVGTSGLNIQTFYQKYKEWFSDRRVYAACFDNWHGSIEPFCGVWMARQDFETVAKKAVELLADMMEGRQKTAPAIHRVKCVELQAMNLENR